MSTPEITVAPEIPEVFLPGGQLYPFQVEGVRSVGAWRGRCLIADEMGVGKTVQAIAWLHFQPRLRPAIIVVPANIKVQWRRQLAHWLQIDPECITVMKGRQGPHPETDLILVNYDILKARLPELAEMKPKVVILDESHFVKEAKSARSKAAKTLASLPSVVSVLGLTGTPLVARPKELWHQLQCIQPTLFPNFFGFAMKYCNPEKKTYFVKGSGKGSGDDEPEQRTSWTFNGASHLDELDLLLRNRVMVRRRKEDVLQDLPDYTPITIPLDVDLRAYNVARDASVKRLTEYRDQLRKQREEIERLSPREQVAARARRAEENSQKTGLHGLMLAEITALRIEAGLAKASQIADWARDVMDAEPLVIFCQFREVTDKIWDLLKDPCSSCNGKGVIKDPAEEDSPLPCEACAGKGKVPLLPQPLDGRMTQARRIDHAERFGDGEWPGIICGIQAMGIGIDGLQRRASHLAFAELVWSSTQHDQAASRLHRNGQKNAVSGYYLIAQNTLDEDLARMVDNKGTVVSAAVGEEDDPGILESLVDSLLGDA